MSDAYQCERCGEYYDGSGYPLRFGKYAGTSGFSSSYDFEHAVEVCDGCKELAFDHMSEWLGDDE